MVKCCKCGTYNKKDKNVKLFTIPIKNVNSGWQTELLKHLGIEEITDKEVYLCSRHFKPEDLEVNGYMWSQKENALPVGNDADLEEEVVVKPEVVYLKSSDEDSLSDSDSEAKELAPLEPLVEYVYEEGDVENQEDVKAEDFQNGVAENGIAEDVEYNTDENGTRVISIMQSEGSNFEVEPMMPFFLTSSPVFTILNENNEVGETIILQIDNPETEKKPTVSTDQISELQSSLCSTKPGTVIGEYVCDICDNAYGCLNCLKSHYETFHIAGTLTHYKCKYSNHISKNTVCPVCDLMFATRSETMDHYITHSVACDICGSGFDRHSHLTDHYKTAHPKIMYETSYECELCKTGYQYPASLAKHYQTFHRMVLCHVCKLRFINVHELQDHENVHREKLNVLPFACSKCDKAFPRISDIVVHIRAEHKKEPAESTGEVTESKVDVVKMPLQKKIKVKK